MCLDLNGGRGPNLVIYGCHDASDPDIDHQQFRIADGNLIEAVELPGHCVAVAAVMGRPWPSVAAFTDGATHVHELAYGVDSTGGGTVLPSDVIYADGVRHAHARIHNMTSATPSEMELMSRDLATRHVHWDEHTFPSFESPGTADAIKDCGATGDGATDDSAALQGCLDKHADVFLPRGRYRLSQTLEMNPGNRLVGLSQTHSVLMPVSGRPILPF